MSCATEIKECPRVLIVGGGVGGLYAAILFKNDFDVTLCETSDRVGGVVRTETCFGNPVELGPSHHLHEHERVRALLAYGGRPDNLEKNFGSGARPEIRCDDEILTMEDVNDIEQKVLWGNSPNPKNKRCVPWADETEAFDGESALINVFRGKGKKMTAAVGYQQALERVARRLKRDNVRVRVNTGVGKVEINAESDTYKALDGSGDDLGDYEYVLVAVPPVEARNISLPVPAPSDRVTRPVSSSRIVLCFSNDGLRQVPECFKQKVMRVGTHYVSDEDGLNGYRWAVVLDERALLVSYTDGKRAEHLLRMEEKQRVETVLTSFLRDMQRKSLLEGVVTNDQILTNCEWFAGGSTHAFHVPGTESRACLPLVTRDRRVFFVGEAYAPAEYRAWMEGACFTAELAYNIVSENGM